MEAQGRGLTRRQERAIEALLTTTTRAEAAQAAGCAESSIYKWLVDPVFMAELIRRENILRRETGRQLAQDAKKALDLIRGFIEDERTDKRLRLKAADLWLSYLIKTQDDSEIEERLTALERRLGEDD